MTNLEISPIIQLQRDKIDEEIGSNKIKVAVIGIGRIGLPTAIMFAKAGFETVGIDINKNLVQKINNKIFPLNDEPGMKDIFIEVIENKKLSATTSIETGLSKTNVIILSLPTPMSTKNIPDYSSLEIVGNQLYNYLNPGSLVIVESTVEPGFIEKTLSPIIEGKEKKFEIGKNFGLGVCPETANPGEILKDFKTLPRLVGGLDSKSAELISLIYSRVFSVDLILLPGVTMNN